MNLTRYQLDVAVYAMHQAIELSGLVPNSRVRPEVDAVLHQLNDLLEVACDHESESVTGAGELTVQDSINVAQVAEILECSQQWVRQIKEKLGARRCTCGFGWVFDSETVARYADERH
jgi:hypothetical protein